VSDTCEQRQPMSSL